MKAFILMILVTMTVTLFAHARISMTKLDLKIMNEIVEAMSIKEVRLFVENATFDSVSAQFASDGKSARFDISGEMTMPEGITCGPLKLSLQRHSHVSDQTTLKTFTADLDTSKLASYCVLSYRDPKR